MPLPSNRFVKNTSWLLFGRIAQMVLQFLVGVFSARYLGPENYGTINYVASFITFFTSFCGLGLNGVIVSEFVNHPEEEGKIVGSAVLMRFAVSLLSVIAFLSLIYAVDGKSNNEIFIVAVLQSVQLPFSSLDTINYWYQSKFLSKFSSIFQTAAYFLVSVYKVYLLLTHKSIYWFAFSSSLDIILLSILYFIGYEKQKTQRLGFSFATSKRLLKGCIPFILASVMMYIYSQTDRIMIKQMLGSTALVGLYTASTVITNLISFIPVSFIDSARPLIMEAKNDSEQKFNLRIRQTVALVSWICFLYGLFIVFFAPLLIKLLYGAEYTGATETLRIMVWADAFSFIGGIRSIWLICEKKNKYVLFLSAIGAVTNVVLNFALIPKWGINGAAFATLITQFLSNLIYPSFFRETREFTKVAFEGIALKNVQLRGIASNIFGRKNKNGQ